MSWNKSWFGTWQPAPEYLELLKEERERMSPEEYRRQFMQAPIFQSSTSPKREYTVTRSTRAMPERRR